MCIFYTLFLTPVGHELVWGPLGGAPGSSGVWAINYRQVGIFFTLFVILAGHELAWGPGAEPPEAHGLWAINNGQMSIFFKYLFVTLAGHKLVLGPGGGAPRSSGILYIKLSSDEHILYLICGTGRSRIGVRSRGRSPRKLRGFGQ